MIKMFEKLDSRCVLQLECYSELAGEDLARYFKKIEEYCAQNYRGKNYQWIGELKRHLTGTTLQAT